MIEKSRILIIDDDETIRISLGKLLSPQGYIVETAANGKEAIEKTNSSFFHVAIVDVKLPDMEGTDLLVKMRETVPKMRKIMLTGFPTRQNAIDAVNKKADAYLLKPEDVKKILAVISEQLNLQKAEKKYSEQQVSKFIESRSREIDASR